MAHFDHHIVFHLGGDPLLGGTEDDVAGLVAASPGTAAPNRLGIDFDIIHDFDAHYTLCDGAKNLANAQLRRLNTPAGSLAEIGDDPDYGLDILGKLNAAFTAAELASLGPEIQAECMKDPRIADADVQAPFSFADSSLRPSVRAEVAEGPFDLVVPIGELTVEMLRVKG
jgi:hypothetical protein